MQCAPSAGATHLFRIRDVVDAEIGESVTHGSTGTPSRRRSGGHLEHPGGSRADHRQTLVQQRRHHRDSGHQHCTHQERQPIRQRHAHTVTERDTNPQLEPITHRGSACATASRP